MSRVTPDRPCTDPVQPEPRRRRLGRPMDLGVPLGRLHPSQHLPVTLLAEELGFESVWASEHLVFPAVMTGSPHAGSDHPPVEPTTPLYDPFAYLAFLAARTDRIRVGTYVYNVGLRHPFLTARGAVTVDVLSGGRLELGVGSSWLAQEWEAVGLEFRGRGRRVDEAIEVVKRLWAERVIEHHGEHFDFAPVVFEPKPVQHPGPPLLVGGEADVALRRAARLGDGWMGMVHDLESARPSIERLRELLAAEGRDPAGFRICLSAEVETRDDVERWRDLGVSRLIVAPWKRSREALDGLRRLADALL